MSRFRDGERRMREHLAARQIDKFAIAIACDKLEDEGVDLTPVEIGNPARISTPWRAMYTILTRRIYSELVDSPYANSPQVRVWDLDHLSRLLDWLGLEYGSTTVHGIVELEIKTDR